MSCLPCVELEPKVPATATIIWLHGLGADGHDFASLMPELKLPESLGLRGIFPHAPSMPVTINGGYVMPAWYDILEMSIDRRVDVAQLRASAEEVNKLIAREVARGISPQRILLAGFSQGGAVVYEAALSRAEPLGGLLVLSSYLATWESLNPVADHQLPILVQHGTRDPVVPELLGQRACEQLRTWGYQPVYQIYPMEHSLCGPQILAIREWLLACLG
jgi:phospholipase/carboxylesterase